MLFPCLWNIQLHLFGRRNIEQDNAHHCNPDEIFELHIFVENNKPLVFELIDDGTVFDINQFSEPALNNIIHEKRKGGLGIRLVKSIMDKIEYQNRSGRNVCRLTKSV